MACIQPVMNFTIIDHKGVPIALVSEDTTIASAQDALELLMNCSYSGTSLLLIQKHSLTVDFFDLKTGLAGDILQKFSNYKGKLAIIGDFLNIPGKSFRDFITECNRGNRIFFLENQHEGLDRLSAI